jgi:hypothetical protein
MFREPTEVGLIDVAGIESDLGIEEFLHSSSFCGRFKFSYNLPFPSFLFFFIVKGIERRVAR